MTASLNKYSFGTINYTRCKKWVNVQDAQTLSPNDPLFLQNSAKTCPEGENSVFAGKIAVFLIYLIEEERKMRQGRAPKEGKREKRRKMNKMKNIHSKMNIFPKCGRFGGSTAKRKVGKTH